MKILDSYEDRHCGNDCLIEEEVALIECSGSYLVLYVTTYRGWMGTEPRYEEYQYDEYNSAIEKYHKIEEEIRRY